MCWQAVIIQNIGRVMRLRHRRTSKRLAHQQQHRTPPNIIRAEKIHIVKYPPCLLPSLVAFNG